MESAPHPFSAREDEKHRPRQTPVGWLLSVVRLCAALIRTWQQRSRQRRALAELDARLLRDIGVHARAARAEYRKWFWQP